MMLASIGLFLLTVAQSSYSQSSVVVCVPGQCLQGSSNITIGARYQVPGDTAPLQLLPGQYTSQTNPKYLRDMIMNSGVKVSASPGFPNSTVLPLNLTLSPGLATYSAADYSGVSTFIGLSDGPTTLDAQSLALSNTVLVTLSSSDTTLIVWDAIPDFSNLPSTLSRSTFSVQSLESLTCNPRCASSGVCSVSGTCECSPGFAGETCERCVPGFFGPACQACPQDCDTCDEGINGSGRCLKPRTATTCDCENGVCGPDGRCACTTGFQGDNCSSCADGFFRTSAGDCSRCGPGCERCEDQTGTCSSCRPQFTRNALDISRCDLSERPIAGGLLCPSNTFPDGDQCRQCDAACDTCTGPTANVCASCPRERFFNLENQCVGAYNEGICEGTNLIVDAVKRKCDSCGAKCTSCRFADFNGPTTPNIVDRQCTGCVPGHVLFDGKCVEECPRGTFAADSTCNACDSSCGSCAGSADFCTSCSANGQLALATTGACVSSCPQGTFATTSGTCATCHPDCASCSGGNFDQCTSCPASRPVITDGRCLPTCTKAQFFDGATGLCQPCDASCSSCSGPGSSNCLACSSSQQVLRAGSCVAANCEGGNNVVSGLGVCLSNLVVVPKASESDPDAPPPQLPDVPEDTGATGRMKLEWWHILLMALGCAFIFAMFLWCCWRRQKKKKKGQDKTVMYALDTPNPPNRNKLFGWGGRLFGRKNSERTPVRDHPTDSWSDTRLGKQNHDAHDSDSDDPYPPYSSHKMAELKAAEEGASLIVNHAGIGSRGRKVSPTVRFQTGGDKNNEEDLVELIDSYHDLPLSPSPATRQPPTYPSHAYSTSSSGHSYHSRPALKSTPPPPPSSFPPTRPPRPTTLTSLPADVDLMDDTSSIYSQMTATPRHGPDARQPVREDYRQPIQMMGDERVLKSKFSVSTFGDNKRPSHAGFFRKYR